MVELPSKPHMGNSSSLGKALSNGDTGGRADGSTFDGIVPFFQSDGVTLGTGPSNYDVTKPNSAYWARIDNVVQLAQSHGMTVLLLPLAYAQGAGLPWENIWPSLADALSSGRGYGNDQLIWLRKAAGSYAVEGLADQKNGELNALQQAFRDHHGLQCGFCTPGMLITLTELLRDNSDPAAKVFNEAAFTTPPTGQQGNFGRNVLRGFDANQADVGLQSSSP